MKIIQLLFFTLIFYQGWSLTVNKQFTQSHFCNRTNLTSSTTQICTFPTFVAVDPYRKETAAFWVITGLTIRENNDDNDNDDNDDYGEVYHYEGCLYERYDYGRNEKKCDESVNHYHSCLNAFYNKFDLDDYEVRFLYFSNNGIYHIWLKSKRETVDDEFCFYSYEDKGLNFYNGKDFWSSYAADIAYEEREMLSYCTKNDCSDLIW